MFLSFTRNFNKAGSVTRRTWHGDQYHFVIVLLILASWSPASFFSSAMIIIAVISHHSTGPQQHFHNPLRHPCSYCGADGRRRVRRPLGDPSKLQASHGHNWGLNGRTRKNCQSQKGLEGCKWSDKNGIVWESVQWCGRICTNRWVLLTGHKGILVL